MNGMHASLAFLSLAVGLVVALTSVIVARHQPSRYRGVRMALRVVASWFLAIALLVATLSFLPVTPGYEPDHLE
ncbi:biopolymer transport protein ExbB/TolQ [Luteibacter jiangsuensis]|uniref:Biopolymer transport protein ExbB/TolQ n=1 Tax=Luteibacter jiangsuensis TaxID=637577 RepID=A0ABT9SY63_9GAMM|nr:hypothetical protein [Luteibacter jiangsuensis]MDQ0008872.1 biopolymer transport protein ExbB/TolQ [Luteibacter jiangsuensis]